MRFTGNDRFLNQWRRRGCAAIYGRCAALLFFIALGGCKSAFVEQPSDVVGVSGASQTIVVGGSAALSVNVTGSVDKTVSWSSSDASIATVSGNGLSASVIGVRPGGPVAITATLSSNSLKRATFNVTVTPGPVAKVQVSVPTTSLVAGATTTAIASASDANGNVISGKTATWVSSTPAVATVATVDPLSGRVTAVSPGSTAIVATVDGVSSAAIPITVTAVPVASVSVSVSQASLVAGGTAQATATVKDASGATLTGRAVTWTSGSPSIATVNSLGVVSALTPGTVTITASVEGISSAPVTVIVTPVPVAVVGVILQPAESIPVGSTGQVLFTAQDASGNNLSGRTGAASSSNPAVASIGAGGTLTALAPGTTVISVTVEGITGSKTLTVTPAAPAPVATVVVALNPSTIAINGTGSLATAVLRDANGNVLLGRTVTWTSSSVPFATINAATGVIAAVAPGSSVITATSEGRSGSATITVTNVPVSSVELALPATLFTNQTAQATVTPRDAAGNALSLAGRTVTWASSNSLVATVNSSNGLVTAVATGTVVISATIEGKVGQATLNVAVSTCTIQDRSLPFNFTGEISTSDCQFVGLFADFIRVTTSATTVLAMSASGARDRIWMFPTADTNAQTGWGYYGLGSVAVNFLVPSGQSIIAVGATRSVVGPYTLTGAAALQDVDACRQLYVTGSLSTQQVLTAQSCNATAGRYDDFVLYDAVRTCTITMTAASGFTTNLLTAWSGDGLTRLAQGSSLTAPVVSSVLTVSPCTLNGEAVNLRASGVLSTGATGRGVYTLTIAFQ